MVDNWSTLTKNKLQRSEIHSAVILSTRLCIAIQNLSIGIHVVTLPDAEGAAAPLVRGAITRTA